MSFKQKMMIFFVIYLCYTIKLSTCNKDNHYSKKLPNKPNVLIFIVDDLGIGDIGCYGNDTINTPNIDSIAQNGVKFEHNLAAETVCTPSRAALLTGRYAVRSGFASNANSSRVIYNVIGSGGLPQNETTFGRAFQKEGYKTGYFGKWHLGVHKNDNDFLHHPLNHGFDYYYGMPLTNVIMFGDEGGFGPSLNPARVPRLMIVNVPSATLRIILYTTIINAFLIILSSMSKRWKIVFISISLIIILWVGGNVLFQRYLRHVNGIVMRNKDVIEQPVHLPDLTQRLTSEVIGFIENTSQDPFLTVVSYHKVHVALAVPDEFRGKSKHGLYGDSMLEVDWSVGKIVSSLKDRGLFNNTFVYFTSDHGPAKYEYVNGEMHGGFSGKFKGGKASNFEGGLRVPTLAMWPNVLEANQTFEKPTSGLDLFPTLLNIIQASLPKDRIIDGIDFIQKLSPQFEVAEDRYLFHYCGNVITAVTYAPVRSRHIWKIHYQIPDWPHGLEYFNQNAVSCFGDGIITLDKPLLFDVATDDRESSPFSDTDSSYQDVVSKIANAIDIHQKSLSYVENQLTYYHIWSHWMLSQ